MIVRCIIVEDEPLAQERLVEYVRRSPLLELAATFDNATEAFAFLKTNDTDLVFLDIKLGGWSGLEMLETRAVKSKVILTTAYQEHAARAYELDVADYLVKPFTFERFVQAVDRVLERLQSGRAGTRDFIFVKTELRLERILLTDILAIEGQRDYRRIHTTSKRIMTLQTFGEFERQIAPDVICRVHKSYMVALDKIDTVEPGRITIGDLTIPISETYRDRFFALIGHGGRPMR
jgi:two-component system, LytTR family, response regulator